MNERIVLIMSFLLAAATIIVAGLPSEGVNIPVDALVTSDYSIDLNAPVDSVEISGAWDGKGSAQVFLMGSNDARLILDTKNLNSHNFENHCENSCALDDFDASDVVVKSYGAGLYVKNIDIITKDIPMAWASCPGCKKVALAGVPNHNILAITVMILLLIVSSHIMRHVCKNNVCKRGSLGVFVSGAGVLLALFSVSFVSPEGAFGAFVQYTTSVLAAVGVIALFALGAVELVSRGGEWHEKQK